MAAEPQSATATREDAEAYFAHHGIRQLLSRLIFALAQHRPPDPILFMRDRLAKELEVQACHAKESAVKEDSVEVTLEAQEEHDEVDSFDIDILQHLITEKLPCVTQKRVGTDVNRDLLIRFSWAGGFNRTLLEGWVPQPSPCCAAASVAGGLNALWDRLRSSANALTIREVADFMAHRCDVLRSQGQRRLERLLGISEGALESVFQEVDQHLQANGCEWTARKGPKAVTKKGAMNAVREVLRAKQQVEANDRFNGENLDTDGNEFAMINDPFTALRNALGEAFFAKGAASSEGGEEADGVELDPDGGDDEAMLVPEKHSGGTLVAVKTGPNFAQELHELLSKRKGVMRLQQKLPNTSEIGSWGIKQAAEELAAEPGRSPVRVSTFFGRRGGKRILNPLSKWDTEAIVAQQWNAFKAAFSDPNIVFIFHLTNHYALLFAWREWLEPVQNSGAERQRRQILTARRGQRPTVWLDFDEVRNIIIKWGGYNVLQLECLADNHVSAQPDDNA